ncbi:Single-stranded-DNA-specific exonuclease RecJ [Halanaerobium saccharolyticum subsp. saccharolyticum DSM 6643]|uniref:Single-stranded-DNA-specific exonuclease RecJ n=1 Tax=Halanaerobium saccharolyticum subsp. saccharolyticum DSM 6643 TaxID=1293054 RepID=M5E3L1_9FIRM|nr:single-stranded-DNA-specific exonuclease RecJ [Halanaerobium saccharolyticum]CCU80406.1 Single-stranded-DNA-specific exonuclease RecJ [Halanaerobium saccharolyticum subsp. saccharolyticum DSM 6643]
MEKIWNLSSFQENKKIDFLDKILSERNINTKKEKEIYLNSDLKYLSDPFILPEMNKAVKRIKKAVEQNEKILIYGDYDVDGITSTAVLYRFFKSEYGIDLQYFLPDRIKDGYGLNTKSLKKIVKNDVNLIITVDCGITAFNEAKYLQEKGVDLIITDHHTPAEKLPDALAILNHHLVESDNYFASEIAGVGTAYKLVQALNGESTTRMNEELLPIVALGTVADIAPLKNENRIFVKNGLKMINKDKVLGLKTLIEELKISKNNLSAGQIGFIIAPPLNAAGRICDAEEALKLLISENLEETKSIAKKLIKINKQRQQQEEIIYQEAENKIDNINLESEKSIILFDKEWHSGIIGIVASRLLEKYNLPVILFAVDKEKGTAKGSARSISSLNIYQALKHCQSKVLNFGGHKAAAGLSIKSSEIESFKDKFKEYLFKNLTEEDYFKRKRIDLNFDISRISKEFISSLEKFRPFGIANPAPKFLFQNLKSRQCYQMGKKDKHLKIYLENGIQAVAFNLGDKAAEISNNKFDLIAQPEINRWQGQENIQLKVDDYRIENNVSTALVFEENKYSFYDYRNFRDKNKKLNKLLDNKAIRKAAVYINYKKEKDSLKKVFQQHYFFGSQYKLEEDFSHLIFYSLPFSFEQFYKILKDYKNNNKNKINKVILMFSKSDINYNIKLIEYLKQKELAANSKNELDFKGSVRYNKLSRRMDNFMEFKDIIFKNNLFALITNVSNFKEDKNES